MEVKKIKDKNRPQVRLNAKVNKLESQKSNIKGVYKNVQEIPEEQPKVGKAIKAIDQCFGHLASKGIEAEAISINLTIYLD